MRRLDVVSPFGSETLYVGPGNSLSQSFVPSHDGLFSFRFVVLNPALGGAKRYHLQILDKEKTLLREMSVTQSNLSWGLPIRFDFTPISKSKNQKFYFAIKSPDENKLEEQGVRNFNEQKLGSSSAEIKPDVREVIEKTQIQLTYSKQDVYPLGELFYNDLATYGDLNFETYYTGSVPRLLADTAVDFGKKMTSDPLFFVAYLGLLIGLGMVIIRSYRMSIKSPRPY